MNQPRPRPPAATLILGLVAIVMIIGGVTVAILPSRVASVSSEEIHLPGLVRRVSIDVDSGDVSVTGSVRTGATVVRTTTSVFDTPQMTAELDQGVLTIRVRCQKAFFICRVDQAIEVPATAAIEVQTQSGSIDLRNFAASIRLSSSAGAIHVDRVAGDSIDLATSAGPVTASSLTVREAALRSSAGGVTASFKIPPEVVDTASEAGSVEVRIPRGNYAIDATSASGSVTVTGVVNDLTSGRRITARSSAGAVRVTGQ